MPTYTYRCENCDHHFDLHQRFDDPDPNSCLICGHVNSLHRVYKPVGVVFKGSGFYATDHKSNSRASSNGSKASDSSSEGDKPDSSSSADGEKGDKKEKPKAEKKKKKDKTES